MGETLPDIYLELFASDVYICSVCVQTLPELLTFFVLGLKLDLVIVNSSTGSQDVD